MSTEKKDIRSVGRPMPAETPEDKQFDPRTATGPYLDRWAQMAGVYRLIEPDADLRERLLSKLGIK